MLRWLASAYIVAFPFLFLEPCSAQAPAAATPPPAVQAPASPPPSEKLPTSETPSKNQIAVPTSPPATLVEKNCDDRIVDALHDLKGSPVTTILGALFAAVVAFLFNYALQRQ